jgi:hypothetical protein
MLDFVVYWLLMVDSSREEVILFADDTDGVPKVFMLLDRDEDVGVMGLSFPLLFC